MALLQTVGDIQTEFLIRNNRTTTDTFISDVTLNGWTTDAYTWVNAFAKWPYTEGRVSTTYTTAALDDNGEVVFNYPEGWKADSIRYLTIGGKRLQKLQPYEYQRFREDSPSDNKRVFTDFGLLLLINPNTGLSGSLMTWGQFTPLLDATDKTATTVYTGRAEDVNDAIVERMTAYLKRREHLIDEANLHEQTAAAKLQNHLKAISEEQAQYQAGDSQGMWKRLDILNGVNREDGFHRDRFY